MNKKPLFGVAALLAIAIVAAGAFAFGGWRGHMSNETVAAIEAGDYNAYQEAVAVNNIAGRMGNLTQEEFNTLSGRFQEHAAMHAAKQAVQQAIVNNDYAAWRSAMSSVTDDESRMTQEAFDAIVKHQQIRTRIQEAVANNDFETWKAAMSERLQLEQSQLTQENFDRIVERHTAMQNGGFGPREGGMLEGPGGFGGHRGRGMMMP